MKISTNKSGPGDKQQVSDRHYKDEADKKKQERQEGKTTPFQTALRDAESRDLKQFHWSDKHKTASDKPFEGSRPIATRSSVIVKRPELPEKKVVIPTSDPNPPSNNGIPKINITAKKTTITPKYDQKHKGTRGHGVVKNNLLRRIDAALQPDKYGAKSNSGKNININRSTKHNSSDSKKSGYTITPGGDKEKSFTVKKLKPKHVLKAAKEKGYL